MTTANSEATLLIVTNTLELVPGRWNWKFFMNGGRNRCEVCWEMAETGALTLLANGRESDKQVAYRVCLPCAKKEIARTGQAGQPAFTN